VARKKYEKKKLKQTNAVAHLDTIRYFGVTKLSTVAVLQLLF